LVEIKTIENARYVQQNTTVFEIITGKFVAEGLSLLPAPKQNLVCYIFKEDRQCKYSVTLRLVRATIVAAGK
jgi:hypothetical protein